MIWRDIVVPRRATNDSIVRALASALQVPESAVLVSTELDDCREQSVFCLRSNVDDGQFSSVLTIYAQAQPENEETAIQEFSDSIGDAVIAADDDSVDPYCMRLFEPHRDSRRIRLSQPEFDAGRFVIAADTGTSRGYWHAESVSLRVVAPGTCPETGYWVTPAHKASRRHFTAGELMPAIRNDFGATIWQWDTRQEA